MEMVIGKKIAGGASNAAMNRQRTLLTVIALVGIPGFAWADTFTFEVASPVASQDFRMKTAPFVFRTLGCNEPDKPEVSAMAVGLVDGARRSLVLKLLSSRPGVYGLSQEWGGAGNWVVVLQGSCGNAKAGAIVPVGPSGFVRQASKFLTHPATPAEIDAALKTFPDGGYK